MTAVCLRFFKVSVLCKIGIYSCKLDIDYVPVLSMRIPNNGDAGADIK